MAINATVIYGNFIWTIGRVQTKQTSLLIHFESNQKLLLCPFSLLMHRTCWGCKWQPWTQRMPDALCFLWPCLAPFRQLQPSTTGYHVFLSLPPATRMRCIMEGIELYSAVLYNIRLCYLSSVIRNNGSYCAWPLASALFHLRKANGGSCIMWVVYPRGLNSKEPWMFLHVYASL